jgi:hypothetical protein
MCIHTNNSSVEPSAWQPLIHTPALAALRRSLSTILRVSGTFPIERRFPAVLGPSEALSDNLWLWSWPLVFVFPRVNTDNTSNKQPMEEPLTLKL